MPKPENLPTPKIEATEDVKQTTVNVASLRPHHAHFLKPLSIIALCIVSSILTVLALLGTGFIKPDANKTITENRDKLVLQEGEIVADVFKKINPSTVAINVESSRSADRLFGSSMPQSGAGSGVIISKDGYILTNKHVVPENASQVTVVLADGRELKDVKVVGRDPFNDLAFLKANGEDNLPVAEIGDSGSVEVGQKVVAIGNALGEFRNSVTTGIISGIGRPIQAADQGRGSSEKLENLFQTDAAINPGNSGGPLVNLKGEVVGINTAMAEDAEGIGFAIPINDAKGMIKTVLEQGKIIKPYLGVRYIMLNREIARELGLSINRGAYVNGGNSEAIVPGSPADKAGLKERDVITKVQDQELSEEKTLASSLARFAPGDKLALTILRDGREQTITVTLEAYPGI